jgi:7-carboxy-7-deazaguanine synthase
VVITGGEPLVGPDLTPRPGLEELTRQLKALGKHITIETAGVLFADDLACDLMSISPKLSNSTPGGTALAREHERLRGDLTPMKALLNAYAYQFKFVVEAADDIPEIQRLLEDLGSVDTDRVMLMPQARNRQEMAQQAGPVAGWCLDTGFRFSPRLQTVLWDNERGR